MCKKLDRFLLHSIKKSVLFIGIFCIGLSSFPQSGEMAGQHTVQNQTKKQNESAILSLNFAIREKQVKQFVALLKVLPELPLGMEIRVFEITLEQNVRFVRQYLMQRYLSQSFLDETLNKKKKNKDINEVIRKDNERIQQVFENLVKQEFALLLKKYDHDEKEIKLIILCLNLVQKYESRSLFYETASFIAYPMSNVRRAAYQALAVMKDDRTYPLLLKLANSKNSIERTYALDAFYYAKDEKVLPVLLALLNDRNKSVRYYALRTLENMEALQSIPYVLKIIRSDANDEVRVRAIKLLGNIKPRSGLPLLHRALFDKNIEVRRESVNALINYGQRSSAYFISEQLGKEKESDLKLLQIKSMLVLHSSGRMEGLNRIMKEEKNKNILIWALYATGELGDSRSLLFLLNNLTHSVSQIRSEAAIALGKLKLKKSVKALLDRLRDVKENYDVQSAALAALQKINDNNSIAALFKISEGHPNIYLRKQIREMLYELLVQRFGR